MIVTFPLYLTLIRLCLSPIFIPFLFYIAHSYNSDFLYFFSAIVFMLLSSTDFFDGYLARRVRNVTYWGKVLDPMADKSLCFATILTLLVYHRISLFVALVLIGRELYILSLRYIAAHERIDVFVSAWAKLKTSFQFIYLLLCILPQKFMMQIMPQFFTFLTGIATIAMMLSVGSALHYTYFVVQACKRRVYESDFS